MNERNFPHVVELALPPGGFRSRSSPRSARTSLYGAPGAVRKSAATAESRQVTWGGRRGDFGITAVGPLHTERLRQTTNAAFSANFETLPGGISPDCVVDTGPKRKCCKAHWIAVSPGGNLAGSIERTELDCSLPPASAELFSHCSGPSPSIGLAEPDAGDGGLHGRRCVMTRHLGGRIQRAGELTG